MNWVMQHLRPFALAAILIVAASGLLLYSEPSQRLGGGGEALPRVALVQIASQQALDDGASGIVARLAERGFVDGRTMALTRFNAQGDLPTANDIARRVTDGSFDLIVTVSTASAQTVANANRQARIAHVFGIMTDPFSAGLGINRDDPLDHPPYMSGYGSLVSTAEGILMARRMNPGMKRLGLLWHTAEANSLVYAEAARLACADLGIELLEANADTSSAVAETAASLISRGVDAVIVTGDVVVLSAIDALIKTAGKDNVPVFTLIPPNIDKGAIFDLGANYLAIGREIGNLAADVLDGRDLATVPVENRAPPSFMLNLQAIDRFAPEWQVPDDLLESADVLIDQQGVRRVRDAARD